jgi:hypothetical protein
VIIRAATADDVPGGNQSIYRQVGYQETDRRITREFARVYFTKRLNSPSRHRGVA